MLRGNLHITDLAYWRWAI